MAERPDIESLTPSFKNLWLAYCDGKDRASSAAEALEALSGAWRGSWSTFDGRTLRDQLEGPIAALHGQDFDVEHWAVEWSICLEHECWTEYCDNYEPHAALATPSTEGGEHG